MGCNVWDLGFPNIDQRQQWPSGTMYAYRACNLGSSPGPAFSPCCILRHSPIDFEYSITLHEDISAPDDKGELPPHDIPSASPNFPHRENILAEERSYAYFSGPEIFLEIFPIFPEIFPLEK